MGDEPWFSAVVGGAVDLVRPGLYIQCIHAAEYGETLTMQTKVRKWGNSLGLRIPKSFAEEVAVEDGSTVDISVAGGRLVIRAVRAQRYELEDLLAEVREDPLHAEISTGEPRGRESW